MIRPFAAALTLVCGLFLAGCGDSVNEECYEQLATGMTLQQAEKILGSGTEETSGGYGVSSAGLPTGNTGRRDSTKTYSWKSGNKLIFVEVKDGKIISKHKQGF